MIGHRKLSDLKPAVLSSFFAGLAKDGARLDGKPGGYSAASIAKTRNVVSSILRTAVQLEVIDRNPCEKAVLPKGEETAEQIKFFTPEQAKAFLSYIETPYSFKISGHQRVDDTGIPYTVGVYEIRKKLSEQIRILFNLASLLLYRPKFVLYVKWLFFTSPLDPHFGGFFDGKRIRTNRSNHCAARVFRFVLIIPYGHTCATNFDSIFTVFNKFSFGKTQKCST